MREDAAAESDLAKAGYRDRLLTELAQNAADAAAREGVEGSLWVDVDGRTMTVANTGRPLDEPGVHALTALRASNKVDADEGVTGRFGVGFSAVLSVSDEVELRSSTGSIRFSASQHFCARSSLANSAVPETGVPVLRLVWPSGELPSDGADSEVVLTLRPDVDAAALLSQMTREAVDLLLELPALGSIRLGEKTFRRSERVLDSGLVEIAIGDRTWWQYTAPNARWLVPVRDGVVEPVADDVLRAPTRSDEELVDPRDHHCRHCNATRSATPHARCTDRSACRGVREVPCCTTSSAANGTRPDPCLCPQRNRFASARSASEGAAGKRVASGGR